MKRLFTFGCSHTQHDWPTWAHILSLGFDEFYNFGKAGTGDFRILNQVMRANEHFKFTNNDYVAIALSCNFRYDIIEDVATPHPTWVSLGSMLDDNYHKTDFQKFLNNYGGYENKLTIIKSLKNIFKNTDNVNHKIFSAFEIDYPSMDKDTAIEYAYYLDSPISLEGISNSYKNYEHTYFLKPNNTPTTLPIPDGHFIIPIHLRLIKDIFSDWYDDDNDKMVWEWEESISDNVPALNKTFKWMQDSSFEFIGNRLTKNNLIK